jgi:hypothetical protein
MLGEEAPTVFARRRQDTQISKKIADFGMFVRPSSCAYVTPQLRFLRPDEPRTDATLLLCSGPLDRPAKNIAHLNRSVVAVAEHFERSNSRERAHFVKHRSSAVKKEALDRVERGRAQFLEETESKCLRDGGLDAVEDCIGASAFNPSRTAFRE